MVVLDETFDGGADGFDDSFDHNEVDHSQEEPDYAHEHEGPEYEQQEYYENDADDFESAQCAADQDFDYGGDDY